MSEYLDAIYENISKIQEIADDLSDLADAFERTGNYEMFRKIIRMAITLNESSLQIRKAVSDELTRELKIAQEASVNVLNAALSAHRTAVAENELVDASNLGVDGLNE